MRLIEIDNPPHKIERIKDEPATRTQNGWLVKSFVEVTDSDYPEYYERLTRDDATRWFRLDFEGELLQCGEF